MKYQKEFDRWFRDDGDNSHLLNHNLNENSIVFDVGGYIGEFSRDIISRYNSKVYVFEPINEYYKIIENKFIGEDDYIKIFNFGLSSQDKELVINIDGDASSFHKINNLSKKSICKVKSFSKFCEENNINKIDLLKINIEGDEYDLINHIIDTGLITKINFLQVQFHDFINNAEEKRTNIQELLKKTHDCKFEYKFVWEGWQKI